MKTIRNSSENEMILEFLKGELNSSRFNKDLKDSLEKLNLSEDIIINGNLNNQEENNNRIKIMGLFRGYPNKKLFKNFPKIDKWEYVELSEKDINSIYYIDYDYWNELSNNTSLPTEAAASIQNGKIVFDVPNKHTLDGVEYLKTHKFPPVILITCNNQKYLIIEGHSRMTVYGFDPTKLNGTYAYIGHCSKDEMMHYDKRMI